MKRLLFFLWLALISFSIQAQDGGYEMCIPSCNKPDTAGKVPVINNYGDPLSGVHLKTEGINGKDDDVTVYLYQCDANRRPVKQIVVLDEQYSFAPADLRDSTFTYKNKEYRVRGALRVAAVTDREYQALQQAGKIWGDAFRVYRGLNSFWNDTIQTNAYLIFAIKAGREADVEEMPDNALELMYFRIVIVETGQPVHVLCAAPCEGTNQGNYKYWTERNSRKGYSSPSHRISKDEYRRWMERIGKPVEKPKPKKPQGAVQLQRPYLAGTKET